MFKLLMVLLPILFTFTGCGSDTPTRSVSSQLTLTSPFSRYSSSGIYIMNLIPGTTECINASPPFGSSNIKWSTDSNVITLSKTSGPSSCISTAGNTGQAILTATTADNSISKNMFVNIETPHFYVTTNDLEYTNDTYYIRAAKSVQFYLFGKFSDGSINDYTSSVYTDWFITSFDLSFTESSRTNMSKGKYAFSNITSYSMFMVYPTFLSKDIEEAQTPIINPNIFQ